MAGHLPIPTTGEHLNVVRKFKTMVGEIKNAKFFDRHKLTDELHPNIQRLTPEYEMNEDHGKVDDEIISYNVSDYSWEIHLDKNGKINQVYLVM